MRYREREPDREPQGKDIGRATGCGAEAVTENSHGSLGRGGPRNAILPSKRAEESAGRVKG